MKFSLRRKQEEIEIEDLDGQASTYYLRELSGAARDKYLNRMKDRMKFDDKGKPCGIKSFDGLQSSLLQETLYDSENKLVERKVLDQFPASVLDALYTKSQELSALDEKEEIKND